VSVFGKVKAKSYIESGPMIVESLQNGRDLEKIRERELSELDADLGCDEVAFPVLLILTTQCNGKNQGEELCPYLPR
jgi:hypothetical protein